MDATTNYRESFTIDEVLVKHQEKQAELESVKAEAEISRVIWEQELVRVKAELSEERIAHAATESDLVAHAEALAAALRELVAASYKHTNKTSYVANTAIHNATAALAAYDNPAKRDEKEQKQ